MSETKVFIRSDEIEALGASDKAWPILIAGSLLPAIEDTCLNEYCAVEQLDPEADGAYGVRCTGRTACNLQTYHEEYQAELDDAMTKSKTVIDTPPAVEQ